MPSGLVVRQLGLINAAFDEPAMTDKYASFEELKRHEVEGEDFVRTVRVRHTGIAVIAPHGGKIEIGTSEIARRIAGDAHGLYLFEGIKDRDNGDLHITSNNFDDPDCLRVIRNCSIVIAIHGKARAGRSIQYGGRDICGRDFVRKNLSRSGIKPDPDEDPSLQGQSRNNICNRGRSGSGIQLEIRRGLRDELVEEPRLLRRFCRVVRESLEDLVPEDDAGNKRLRPVCG
jgi:phage replication-related protein YjqB (UPF0714/DUF867 family)